MSRIRNTVLDSVTVILAVCAVLVTVSVLRGGNPASVPTREDQLISNWRQLAEGGHLRGQQSQPIVTITEFGDFECPACRGFEKAVAGVRAKYPQAVQVAFHHWPLDYHESAYAAARASECADAQGAYDKFHDALFASKSWIGQSSSAFVAMAKPLGVPDLERFSKCVSDTAKVPRIERDMLAARSIQAKGTPTILINGTLLGNIPQAAQLDTLVMKEIARSRVEKR